MSESPAPLVSVGIPTYNQPAFLRQAIQSVLNQTFQNFEIIVVDDCSTDGTPQVVEWFSDSRIRYHRTPSNLRPPKSWNVAVELARGTFFALLPHDDVWLPDFLEIMVASLQKRPDAGFAQGNFYETAENLVIAPVGWLPNAKTAKGLEAVSWQLEHLRCNPAAILFHLEMMKKIGPWREDYWDDWGLIVRLAYSFGFCYIPTYHAAVRAHGNNLSGVLRKEGRPGGFYVVDQLFDIFGHMLPQSAESLALYSKHIRRVSISLFFTSVKSILRGSGREALQAYRCARGINWMLPFDYALFPYVFSKVISRRRLRAVAHDPAVLARDQDCLTKLLDKGLVAK